MPTSQEEQNLMDINDDAKEVVILPQSGKKFNIGFTKPYCTERLTRIVTKVGVKITPEMSELDVLELMDERTYELHKAAAYICLASFYKIKLFHWILWRWFAFVKEYNFADMTEIIAVGKKKIQSEDYLMGMTLMAMMTEEKKSLAKKQAKQYQTELLSAVAQHSGKNTPGQ